MKRMLKMMLFLVLLAGTIASGVSAVITLVPDSSASKASMLGYKSHCSFTTISTIILIIMAFIFGFISVRMYVKMSFRL
ncbi:MAG: hypothetical protein ACE5I5_06860 [Candidatus Heimdallarchaeota archaeon]